MESISNGPKAHSPDSPRYLTLVIMTTLFKGQRTLMSMSVSCFFCFLIVVSTSSSLCNAKAVRVLPQDEVASKPSVFIDIPNWENRTSYPRFVLIRDHIRRRLDSSEDADLSKNQSAISLPNVEAKPSDDSSAGLSSIEKLLGMRNGINTKKSRAKNNAKEILTRTVTSYFMTTGQLKNTKQHIEFPKDKTNPCNRLQIDVEVEKNKTSDTSGEKEVTSLEEISSSQESFELGNRENFVQSQASSSNEDDLLLDIRDAVPTFDLTVNIVQLSNWTDENVIFSPLSIANVLSMLLLGANGETFIELSSQLDKVTTSSWDIRRYHDAFRKLLFYLKNESGKEVNLSIASEIFVDKDFPIKEDFRQELQGYYDAPLESINFGQDGALFQRRVNQWVKDKTNNQIQSILDEPPAPTTTMGLINAIYFKGPWEMPFSERFTRPRDFHVQPQEIVKAPMMINIMTVPYIERNSYRMVGLPYKGNLTGLFLILPKGNDGINDLLNLEKNLSRHELNESLSLMEDRKVAVTLPKLKFSSDGHMKEILEGMGMSTLFNQERANFSRISSEGLYISSLFHRAVVEINEKGTEASAVTIGTGDRIFEDVPVPFACDKPFIFFIHHAKADSILFWGRVIRPEAPPT